MSLRLQTSAAILALVLSAGCHGESSVETVVERSWPAGSVTAVELHASTGDVVIKAGPAVAVTAKIDSSRRRSGEPEEELVLFEVREGRLLIKEKQRRRARLAWLPFIREPGARISYEMTVPASLPLSVENVNGGIRSEGVGGKLKFETVNGSVSARGITGRVEASTINGKVFVGYLNSFEGASLSSVNGGITIELPSDASFHTDISQVNGTFRSNVPMTFGDDGSPGVHGGQHPLELSTINGSIEVNQRAVTAPAAATAATAPPI